jgi:hypothetical protein
LLKAESGYSLYCLIRRGGTPRIIYSRELQMYELCAGTLGSHFLQESILPAMFNMESCYSLLCLYQGVTVDRGESFYKFWRTPPAPKGILKQKKTWVA